MPQVAQQCELVVPSICWCGGASVAGREARTNVNRSCHVVMQYPNFSAPADTMHVASDRYGNCLRKPSRVSRHRSRIVMRVESCWTLSRVNVRISSLMRSTTPSTGAASGSTISCDTVKSESLTAARPFAAVVRAFNREPVEGWGRHLENKNFFDSRYAYRHEYRHLL